MQKQKTPTSPEATTPEQTEPIVAAAIVEVEIDEYTGLPVGPKNDAPIQIADPEESAAAKQMRLFRERIVAERNKPEVVYVPPPMNARQLERREAEMNAGKARVARAKEQEALRPKPVKTPTDGTMTPVYRPADYSHEPGNPSKELRTVRG